VTRTTAVVDESRIRYEGWPVVIAGAAGVFFASLIVVTFPVFLKPLAAEFSWSREAISRAFAIAALVAGVAAAPLGHLLDRVPPRAIVVPSLVLLGGTFASLFWLTPRLAHLYAAFAVLGIAGIGTSPVAYARAVTTWFTKRRGLALALVITGGSIGGMVHPPVADALVQRYGWRMACVILGALVLAVGVPLAMRFVRERPASPGGGTLDGAGLGEGIRSRKFLIVAVALVCGTMVQNGVIVHLSALLTDRGFTPAQGAVALSAMALSAVLGRILTGIWIDRMFAGRVLVALMALAAVGALLLAHARSFGIGVIAAMLVGFGIGGESDVVPYLLSRYFGLRSFSAIFGVAWLANAIGGASGPVVMGRAFDATGTYERVLIQFAIALVLAAALLFALPRYDRVPTQAD